MAHDYAVRLSLIAFVTATAQGVIAGSAFEPALKFALAAGAICYGLGWLCGELARRVVEESVEAEFKPQQPPATAAPSPTPGR